MSFSGSLRVQSIVSFLSLQLFHRTSMQLKASAELGGGELNLTPTGVEGGGAKGIALHSSDLLFTFLKIN